MEVALGISPHTGWAVAVAVAGTADGPEVVLRQRVELVDPSLPGAAYHAAAGAPANAADALVRAVERSARERSSSAVAGLRDELAAADHRLVAVALCAEPHEVPTDVATVLANHTLMHTAEGELYREAIESAVADLTLADLATAREPDGDGVRGGSQRGDSAAQWVGVPLLQVRRKEVAAEAQRRLGLGEARQQALLAALGAGLGPPWRVDHKQATLLALVALADQVPGTVPSVASIS
jgi:hypothetical protein